MKLYINKDLYEFFFLNGEKIETKLVSDLSKDYSSVVNSLE